MILAFFKGEKNLPSDEEHETLKPKPLFKPLQISQTTMNREDLYYHIKQKKSFLCIGLDTDIAKIPLYLLNFHDPVYEFNKQIIKATHDLCVAYKPNIAFYEARGSES